MTDPADRVRVAIAPSMVIRFSSPRLPLMLNPPSLRLSARNAFIALPLRTPAFSSGSVIGLRPFNAMLSKSLASIVFRFWVSNCSGVDEAWTSTFSLRTPVASVASSVSFAAASRRTPVRVHFLNPGSSTSMS